jgi:hypothetical protein
MGGTQRFCTKCGHELRTGTRFCTSCGQTAPLTDDAAAQAGADSGNRDFMATTTMPAPPRHDAARRPWPQAEPAEQPQAEPPQPPPADTGAAFSGMEATASGALPQAGDQIPRQYRRDEYRPDEYRPDEYRPAEYPRDQPPPSRRRPLLVTSLVAVAAAAIAAAVILTLHPFGHHAAAPAASSKPPKPVVASSSASPTPTPTPTPGPSAAQQQAADSLAALLSQSAGDRNSINAAYQDVARCGPNLDQDAQVFRSSAASRQQLLQQLADLPARSALSGPMLQDLTGAWQASLEADQDFAAWAQDLVASCVPNQPDPNFAAANGPDLRATADKKAFLRLWNPLAAQYNLATYQQNKL